MAKRKVKETITEPRRNNMYTSSGFDTHKPVKSFTLAGMKEVQAEAIVEAIVNSRDHDLSKLATKEQIESVKEEMKLYATKEQLGEVKIEIHAVKGQVEAVKVQLDSFKESVKEQFESVKEEQKLYSTKEALEVVKDEVKAIREEMKLYATKDQLSAEISGLEARLLKWFIATAITMTGILSGIIIAAAKFIH